MDWGEGGQWESFIGHVLRDRKTGYLQGGERREVYRHTLKVMFVSNDSTYH